MFGGYVSASLSSSDEVKPPQVRRAIKAERLDQGMSQEQLAELAGVHRTYVGQVERGEVSLTLDSIVKLARGLGKDPGILTAGL